MAEATPIKLPLLGRRKKLPTLPDQDAGTSYGVVWDVCDEPRDAMCYVVQFMGGSQARILGYVSDDGFAYRVDRPVGTTPATGADLAIATKHDGSSGGIYVKSPAGELVRIGSYVGSVESTLREDSSNTWNGSHEMPYRDFMATLFLHYCVLSPDAAWERRASEATGGLEVDTTFGKLDEPVELFSDFRFLSLPDAIEGAIFRIDAKERPSGFERYARGVLETIDLTRLRALTELAGLAMARIDRTNSFYINFDRSNLSERDVSFVLGVEGALNRISRVLDVMGPGLAPVVASPSEEACSAIDLRELRMATSIVPMVLDRAGERNPWACPGTVTCEPGGEWDVRTRLASTLEGLNLIMRLEYVIRFDARTRTIALSFLPPAPGGMPVRAYRGERDGWASFDAARRAEMAREFAARMSLVLAASAFGAALDISTCLVEERAFAGGDATVRAFARTSFLARLLPLARELEESPLQDGRARAELARYAVAPACFPNSEHDDRYAAPREDGRELPPRLRDLLLADKASDLEVMEEEDEPRLARVAELRQLALADPVAAADGLNRVIEEIEAECAAAELLADGPVASQYSEGYAARMLMGIAFADKRVRIHRVPDALFNAQFEITTMFARHDDFERALPEARKLLDMAETSTAAHFSLINVPSKLDRFDDIIEVARHGLTMALGAETVSYYLYRLAYAYWNTDEPELALACYRLVGPGSPISGSAAGEMRSLLAEMGRGEPYSLVESRMRLEAAGVPIAPTEEVSNLFADAAVMLVDAGFFALGARCVFEMWRQLDRDDLNAVHRSLMP